MIVWLIFDGTINIDDAIFASSLFRPSPPQKKKNFHQINQFTQWMKIALDGNFNKVNIVLIDKNLISGLGFISIRN